MAVLKTVKYVGDRHWPSKLLALFLVCDHFERNRSNGSGSFVDPARIRIATPSLPAFPVSHGMREIRDSQFRVFDKYVDV